MFCSSAPRRGVSRRIFCKRNSFFRITAFFFPKKEQLLSESVFSSVAGKNSDWLSLSRAFSVSSGKYSLAVRRKYGFACLFRNLSKKSRLRCFAVLSVRKAYKTRQPNAIVLWRTISEDNAVLWVFRALKTLTNPSFSRLHHLFPRTPFIPCGFIITIIYRTPLVLKGRNLYRH